MDFLRLKGYTTIQTTSVRQPKLLDHESCYWELVKPFLLKIKHVSPQNWTERQQVLIKIHKQIQHVNALAMESRELRGHNYTKALQQAITMVNNRQVHIRSCLGPKERIVGVLAGGEIGQRWQRNPECVFVAKRITLVRFDSLWALIINHTFQRISKLCRIIKQLLLVALHHVWLIKLLPVSSNVHHSFSQASRCSTF